MTTSKRTHNEPVNDGKAIPATELPENLRNRPDLLFNRELSLLEFHRRVLEEALDESHPLLERVKFLSIFSSNIDEFFMIRVSGLKEVSQDEGELSAEGLTPREQLRAIRAHLLPMFDEQMRCLREDILPGLKAQGISVESHDSLTDDEKITLREYFIEHVFPVLTPQAVDQAHPFPYIPNLSLNLGLMVEPIREHGVTSSLTGGHGARFVRINIPPLVPRFVRVGGAISTRFVMLGDLIAANVDALFPRMRASESHLFRVTRDADIEIRDDDAHDLLRTMQLTLSKRRFGDAVRLEVASTMPAPMVEYLVKELGLTADDVYALDGSLHVHDLMGLYKLNRPELKDQPLRVIVPTVFKKGSPIFDVIKRRDVLLHHPYTSYSSVVDFINEAARDPDVVAIKMCLYRTGANSPIPQALIEASERGKQVTAIVELKARFDEEANIEWAKRLERAGVGVVYGVVGLKTHCKVALVVRREGENLQRYVHIATGNYNPATSTTYTDLGLLTADEDIGADASDLFNFLTGFSRQKGYLKLLVAPVNLREKMIALIEREAEHHKAGRPARVIVKLNRIADLKVIRALYEASQAGVPIELIVRGVCMLRPGVPGLSETIRIRSVVGRFLEHSRVFYFLNGGEEDVYVGSSDWMPRNLERRVEVIAPVLDPKLKRYLKDELLDSYLRDNVKARELQPDGSYARVKAAEGEERVDAQMYFEARDPMKA